VNTKISTLHDLVTLVDNTWAGWKETVIHSDVFYLYANITFQFVSELDDKLFFVVSFNDIMPDGTCPSCAR
jgi:hypothetical protein